VTEAWRNVATSLVPLLEKLIADEAHLPESAREQRFRAGLYAYTERDDGAREAPAAPGATVRRPPQERDEP